MKDILKKNLNWSNNLLFIKPSDIHSHKLNSNDIDMYTDKQWEIYNAYSMPRDGFSSHYPALHFRVIAKTIEVALNKAKNEETGKVDLEDALAMTRLGETKVRNAQRAAESWDFADYITAKDKQGKFIIPAEEQEFLKLWWSYIH